VSDNAPNASQCLGWGTRLPARTVEALDVDIPVTLAITVRDISCSPGSSSRVNHAGSWS
jgi:hypothetical protein